MAAEPVTFSAALRSTASADEVLARLRRLPVGSSVRFDQPGPATLLASSGSRLKYRLLGSWSGGEHLPLTLQFKLAPHEDGTSVHVTLTSDAGRYLVQTPRGRGAYQARFEELVTAIEENGIAASG